MSNIDISNFSVLKVPEGALDIHGENTLDSLHHKTEITNAKRKQKEQQHKVISVLEKKIKRKNQKKLIKTASINDVAEVLGKKYKVERDTNYKCRRWIIKHLPTNKEYFIRYNDPLILAVSYIKKYGAKKFIDDYSLKSKYN